MEGILGSIAAIILSAGYTQFIKLKLDKAIENLEAKVAKVEIYASTVDKQALQKMMITVQPIAGAVKKLQDTVGIQ